MLSGVSVAEVGIDAPRGVIVQRNVATDDIETIIREGNRILHIMDKMINTFATVNPEFVAAYKKAGSWWIMLRDGAVAMKGMRRSEE